MDKWSLASSGLGYLSIVIWVCAQVPQVIKHFRTKSVEGVSPHFLAAWVFGDLASLIAAIKTHQLFFQRALCVYFCILDAVILVQYYMYKEDFAVVDGMDPNIMDNSNRRRKSSSSSRFKETINSTVKLAGLSSLLGTASAFDPAAVDTRTIQFDWGVVLSYLAASLYLVSRIPQIYHNFCRRSTNGVSIYLFFCAIGGNLTYALSIFCSSICLNSDSRNDFLMNELPFILASCGTLLFDFVILGQWIFYDNATRGRRRYTEFMDRMVRPYFGKSQSLPVETTPLIDATWSDYRRT